jgi:hypothetical protein
VFPKASGSSLRSEPGVEGANLARARERGVESDHTATDAVADGAAVRILGFFLFALATGAGGGGHDGAGDGLGSAASAAARSAAAVATATAAAVTAALALGALGFLLFLGGVDEVHDELVGGVTDKGVDREAQ